MVQASILKFQLIHHLHHGGVDFFNQDLRAQADQQHQRGRRQHHETFAPAQSRRADHFPLSGPLMLLIGLCPQILIEINTTVVQMVDQLKF